MWRSEVIKAWLEATRTPSGDFIHLRLLENPKEREAGLQAIAELVHEAHRDARERFERLFDTILDPLASERAAPTYPDSLHTLTLQGYLGEILAGLVAENYDPHGREWIVPAFLFRDHSLARQEIARQWQLGGPAKHVPGRTGDDVVAFATDQAGNVDAWLYIEAKCSHDHDAGLVSDGYKKLSSVITAPIDVAVLIDILSESDAPEDERWIGTLRELFFETPGLGLRRFNMLVYVCGRKPIANETWIGVDGPHASYTGSQPVQATEIHFQDFDIVLCSAYPTHSVNRG
jgi:hypothetical protein